MATLHIVDGESVASTLRESAIPGDIAVYGDLLYEGPTPAGLDGEAWRAIRARFMAEAGYATTGEARSYLNGCDMALAASSRYKEVVIWLDYRLSDQLILLKVLDWFHHQPSGGVELSLICVGRYPGIDRFVGLGELTAHQLASLGDTRARVTETQFRLAQSGWNAFTSPDPASIERFIGSDTSALPFLAGALRRHLEQFPSADRGLSRTERQALSVLLKQGSLSGRKLFAAVQRLEEQIFMGDCSFYRLMADLSRARHPLLQVSDASPLDLAEVTISEAGRKVIEGSADHVDLNGIDRWLGGVHLKGDKAAWRWDSQRQSLIFSR